MQDQIRFVTSALRQMSHTQILRCNFKVAENMRSVWTRNLRQKAGNVEVIWTDGSPNIRKRS